MHCQVREREALYYFAEGMSWITWDPCLAAGWGGGEELLLVCSFLRDLYDSNRKYELVGSGKQRSKCKKLDSSDHKTSKCQVEVIFRQFVSFLQFICILRLILISDIWRKLQTWNVKHAMKMVGLVSVVKRSVKIRLSSKETYHLSPCFHKCL